MLPTVFTADAEWLARFEREARMLASLNHPHIGAIYGLEESSGIIALGRLVWTPARGYQPGQAIREYRRAVALNPTLDEARFQLGQLLAHVGLFDEALEELAQAVRQNPDNIRADSAVAQVLLYQGKYTEALAALTRLPVDFNPALVGYEKAWALFALGRKGEALAVLDEYDRNSPQDRAGTFGSMRAVVHAARVRGDGRVALRSPVRARPESRDGPATSVLQPIPRRPPGATRGAPHPCNRALSAESVARQARDSPHRARAPDWFAPPSLKVPKRLAGGDGATDEAP